MNECYTRVAEIYSYRHTLGVQAGNSPVWASQGTGAALRVKRTCEVLETTHPCSLFSLL